MCIKPNIAMTVIYLFKAMGPDNSSQNSYFDKFICRLYP